MFLISHENDMGGAGVGGNKNGDSYPPHSVIVLGSYHCSEPADQAIKEHTPLWCPCNKNRQMHHTRILSLIGEGSMMEDMQYFEMQCKKLQVLEMPARIKYHEGRLHYM